MESGPPSTPTGLLPASIPGDKACVRPQAVSTCSTATLDDFARLTGAVILAVDSRGACVDVSSNIHALLGYWSDEFIGRKLQDLEPRSQEGPLAEGASTVGRLIFNLQENDLVATQDVDLMDASGQVRTLAVRGIAMSHARAADAAFLLSAIEHSHAVQPSRGNRSRAASRSGKPAEDFRESFVESIHRLNNLLTAFGCQWELAVNRRTPDASPLTVGAELSATFEQLSRELLELSRSCSSFLLSTTGDRRVQEASAASRDAAAGS